MLPKYQRLKPGVTRVAPTTISSSAIISRPPALAGNMMAQQMRQHMPPQGTQQPGMGMPMGQGAPQQRMQRPPFPGPPPFQGGQGPPPMRPPMMQSGGVRY
ncbi:uncharacterized protein LOC100374991 [Saccoglossus kowalevskii]|uniref:Zinc finger protein 207-like n=1 Tax=Saccoglossus kowalevskii TaxID=10224 RepID=A0ABM0MJG7_SACKO|nr:PREDICTED: zinc finger protein 207-like [Saccoglossus kowalevskii]